MTKKLDQNRVTKAPRGPRYSVNELTIGMHYMHVVENFESRYFILHQIMPPPCGSKRVILLGRTYVEKKWRTWVIEDAQDDTMLYPCSLSQMCEVMGLLVGEGAR